MAIIINPISPVAFSVFGLDIRWYALAYVASFIIGFYMFRALMRKDSAINLNNRGMDDLLTTVILGVILGGRLGYVLVYDVHYFLARPLEIFALWHGGMSFHGGLVGVIVAVFWFAWRRKINPWRILDIMTVIAPIGLFFGRIANFINMEVMGRPTNMPWGVIFSDKDYAPAFLWNPRHPSPIYEAATEGVLLFILMLGLYRWTKLRNHPGALAGIFGMAYAVARISCEQFRDPDPQLGFLTSWGLTMGQLLSLVMFVAGAAILVFSLRRGKKQPTRNNPD